MKPNIDQIRGVGDFATTVHWDLAFDKFPEIGSYPDTQDVNLRCASSNVPTSSVEPVTAAIRGHQVHQPGLVKYSTLDLHFIETVDNVICNFLSQWREACYQTGTGAQGEKSQVEATIRLTRLNRQDEGIWAYVLTGCILTDVKFNELASENGLFMPDLSITYDYFKDSQP